MPNPATALAVGRAGDVPPARECIVIATSPFEPHPAAALPPREAGWLAWQALDQSDDIVLLLESDANARTAGAVVISANGAFRRASGFSDEQLVGRHTSELFPIANHNEILMNAIRDRVSLRAELACARMDGGTFILGFHLMTAPGRTPDHGNFVILGRDITALLEARQMQNSVQRVLAKVFMSVDEAVAIISAAGIILMTNSRIDRLLGHKPNGLVGRRSLDLVLPEARAATGETIKRQMEHGTDQYYVAPLLRADGTQVVTSITSVLVTTEDSKQFRILTLREQAENGPRIRTESAGRIRLVGLDEVRTALGARWQAVAGRAMATAEAVIKRRCGDQDSYSRVDDTSFLICFGTLSEQEASFRAATIGREIRERLIGQGSDRDTAHVRAIAASIRFPDRGQTGATLHSILLDGVNGQLQRLEREARQTLRSALGGAACDLNRISGRDAAATFATQVNLTGELERRVAIALAVLPAEESIAFDPDGLLFGLAAQQVIGALARGDATPFVVTVRFDVFATRLATERYLATCVRIDRRVSSHLILLLSSLPRGLPKTRLLECVNRLRPFCSGVGYQVDDVADLASIDLSFSAEPIVSIPATALVANQPEKLMVLIGSLHARRARVLIRGVASEEAAASFRTIGADMISMRGAG